MQAILSGFRNSFRSLATGTWVGLLIILAICLGAVAGSAQTILPIVVSQGKTLGYFPGGGWSGSQDPLSSTFVIAPNGDVLITDEWGGDLLEISGSGTVTKLAAVSNSGPVAVDAYGNAYVAYDGYNGSIFKLPYDPSKGTYTGFTTAPTVNCQGGTQDTAPCLYAPNFQSVFTNGSGYTDLIFDASGNLFIATSTVPTDNPNTIYKCDATCQTSATGTPTKIFADPNPIGALAIDPWGNLYFSDGNNGQNKTTNLNELPLVSGAYAGSPTVLETYTNKQSWGNGFSGVSVDGNGTIYFATNGDGIFAFPSTQSGGPNIAGLYALSNSGGYGITLDAKGNLYLVHYAGSPPSGSANYAVDQILVNNLGLDATTIGGTATTATSAVIDNSASCTPALTGTITSWGIASSEFAFTPGTSCSAALGTGNGTFSPAVSLTGAYLSATVTFNPATVGEHNAAFVIANPTTKASGTAILTGVGQGWLANLDPGVRASVTTGLTTPDAIVGDPAGDIFIADGAGKVYEIAAGTTTAVAVGSGWNTPQGLAFDVNGNLYVADGGSNQVVEILNTATNGSFVAGTQSTVISASTSIGGATLNLPSGLAFGPNGMLFIADTGNKRVVKYNPINGLTGTTLANAGNGVQEPTGVAFAGGNLYVADPLAGEIFMVSGGVVSTQTASAAKSPAGIAVDASGSLLIADSATGNIVRVPHTGGTFDTTNAITVETIAPAAVSLAIDNLGDIFVATGATGKSAYAIQRTAAAIDIGTVQDGVTNSGTVYLMNAGNQTATIGTPAVTQPSNTMFTLTSAANNACTDGTTGPAGALCQFIATFAPPVSTPDGAQTGIATINFSPSGTATVTMTGTASVSSVEAQTISGFAPLSPVLAGQQITLSATGGGSGNPVVFTIDGASTCKTCATINGTTLAATAAGTIIVDANQAAGANQGVQYAAAPQVQATIVIKAASPAGVPGLIMTQKNWLGALPTGGAFGGATAAGTTFGVTPDNQNIVVGTSYGGSIEMWNLKAAAYTHLGKFANVGAVALDVQGNLYAGGAYNGTMMKLPYANGKFAILSDPQSAAPPQCTGTDTAECTVFTGVSGVSGFASIAFDAQGNMFFATDDQGTAHSIWECTVACENTGSPAPTMLFHEPTAASGANQMYVGPLAVDPWGNLFFTDSSLVPTLSSGSALSNLNELKYTAGTGYGTTPTVIQTFSNKTPGSYDDEMDGLGITADGTIYYGMQYDGVFAIPNTQTGGPDITHQYIISGQGAKEIAVDSVGDVYFVSYNGGDALGQILVGNLTTPIAQLQGAPVTASANVVDNILGCGTAATLAIASTDSQFAATAGTTCSGISVSAGNGTMSTAVTAASSYPATITFAAVNGGQQHSTLTVTDTANGGIGTATVSGVGQETPQTITFTAPTTTTYTFASGLTVNLDASGGGSNNPVTFSVDSSSTGAGTITGNTLTVTQAGAIVIDANQTGGLVNGVYYDNPTQAQLTLTIGKAAQAITFAAQGAAATYTPGLTITLSATGGASTSPVVFSVDASSTGAGTISGSVLTVTQAGNIVINANQATDVNYLAAPQVQQTFVVNQASQTIAFNALTQPLHYIMGGLQIQISATGGATNNPIVFSIDAKSTVAGTFSKSTVSGATSTATLTIMDQSGLANYPVNVVIDATQPGNNNYADATPASETIALQKPLPTQAITFTNPGTQVMGTPLSLAATATSGFPITYDSSTTPKICTVDNSTSTATFIASGTCTITATQPGDNLYYAATPVAVTFAVNPTGQTPSMSMNLSLSSLTLQAGTVGLTQVTVNSVNNFTGSVSFSCSGAPSGYSCSFNPSTVTAFTADPTTGMPLGTTGSTQLSISGGSASAVVHRDSRPLLPVATLAIALCFLGFRKRNRLHLLMLLLITAAGLGLFSGCSSSTTTTKQPATSQITVTATAGKTTQTTTLTLIVE